MAANIYAGRIDRRKCKTSSHLDHLAEKRQNDEANGSTPAYCIYSKLKLRGWILAIYIIADYNYVTVPFICLVFMNTKD